METPGQISMLDVMTTANTTVEPTRTLFHPDPAAIRRAIERRSVATLATVSATGRPHAATVLYQCVDDALFVSTDRHSRKARNVADHGVAAVTIAVRRLPIGPPASIQFQSSARSSPTTTPRSSASQQRAGSTGSPPTARCTSTAAASSAWSSPPASSPTPLGMSLWRAIRNPLDAAGEVHLYDPT